MPSIHVFCTDRLPFNDSVQLLSSVVPLKTLHLSLGANFNGIEQVSIRILESWNGMLFVRVETKEVIRKWKER